MDKTSQWLYKDKNNAKLNGLTNCEFVSGDIAKTYLIIVDPPRPGVHKYVIRDISGL